jgi:hypothetical protein
MERSAGGSGELSGAPSFLKNLASQTDRGEAILSFVLLGIYACDHAHLRYKNLRPRPTLPVLPHRMM